MQLTLMNNGKVILKMKMDIKQIMKEENQIILKKEGIIAALLNQDIQPVILEKLKIKNILKGIHILVVLIVNLHLEKIIHHTVVNLSMRGTNLVLLPEKIIIKEMKNIISIQIKNIFVKSVIGQKLSVVILVCNVGEI